jgi:hypothetical protein
MEVIKRKLVAYLVKNLLAAVSERDILTITNRGWFTHNRRLTEEEVNQLKDEARALKGSVLWTMMANEVRYLANINMFEKGDTPNATTFGRAMLYNLQLLEQFIDRCKKL